MIDNLFESIRERADDDRKGLVIRESGEDVINEIADNFFDMEDKAFNNALGDEE